MQNLQTTLRQIGGRGYLAYKQLKGTYHSERFALHIDHVQGDPFASPSRLRVTLSSAAAGWPDYLITPPIYRIALADYLARQAAKAFRRIQPVPGTGLSGKFFVDAGGQEILERTACVFSFDGSLELRFTAGLPAFGRRINERGAQTMLLDQLPGAIESSLPAESNDLEQATLWCRTAEDQEALRSQLHTRKLVSFIANGSILPRQSGVSDQPLDPGKATPFSSPPSLEIELDTPNQGPLRGMGIPEGVTLIVGGGFHGKSTLLKAIERGVYNHIPSDGRDYVVTDANAAKIRAEDGRSVVSVDISGFIGGLPGNTSTSDFTTANASGSTSQAASIVEALEAGATSLLLDEDTCATNFMIRDERMQALVAKKDEPITPLLDQIPQLRNQGLSLILVMGGYGDYLDIADTVLSMNHFLPADVTGQARAVCAEHPTRRRQEGTREWPPLPKRTVLPESFPGGRRGEPKIRVRDLRILSYEKDEIDLSALEQLVDESQTRTLSRILAYLHRENRPASLQDILKETSERLHARGPGGLTHGRPGDLAAVRPLEIAAMLNRYRHLKINRSSKPAY